MIEKRSAELCTQHPGYDVDLYVEADLRTMVDVWRGYLPIQTATSLEVMKLQGTKDRTTSFARWFLLSPFAPFAPVADVADDAAQKARKRRPATAKP